MTLVFLGATAPAEIPAIGSVVGDVARRWSPFQVGTGAGGGYLGERGGSGVAWLELDEGRQEAARLALALDAALGSRAYERRPPRPHLTLARRVTRPLLDDVQRIDAQLQTRFQVERAVLFRSHSGPGSADYEELGSWPLSGSPFGSKTA